MMANKQTNDSYYDTRLALLEQSIGHIAETLIRFEKRFDRIDERMDAMEDKSQQQFNKLDERMNLMENKLDSRIDSNFKWLLGLMIAGFGSVLGIMSHGFHWL